jgi:hypothetical protein
MSSLVSRSYVYHYSIYLMFEGINVFASHSFSRKRYG